MLKVANRVRDRLESGELALGLGLRQARTVDIAKAMKTCGYDWLFIDMEHNSMDLDTAVQISVAAQDTGITPIVRVPGFQHFHASRALDGGAQGIVFPHVDTPEAAAELASYCLYPPRGRRSVAGAVPQIDFESHPLGETTAAVNASVFVVMMIETPEAVENADAIAAIDGVDCLLVGSNDLSMELGIPGQVGDAKIADALEKVVTACRAHGKHPGLGGVYNPTLMQRYVEIGMRFILCGNDIAMLMAAATERANTMRALKF